MNWHFARRRLLDAARVSEKWFLIPLIMAKGCEREMRVSIGKFNIRRFSHLGETAKNNLRFGKGVRGFGCWQEAELFIDNLGVFRDARWAMRDSRFTMQDDGLPGYFRVIARMSAYFAREGVVGACSILHRPPIYNQPGAKELPDYANAGNLAA